MNPAPPNNTKKKWPLLEVFANREMFIILLMGLASGLPLALVGGTLQAWMTESGSDLKAIGLSAYFGTPYVLKFLWAPVMDRFKFFGLGRRKTWMFFSQILLIASIVWLGQCDPKENLALVAFVALLISFFGASQDIVLDAWRRDALPPEQFGMGNSIHITGWLFSFRMIGGALALILAEGLAWSSVYSLMAAFVGLGLVATILCKEPEIESTPQSFKESVIDPFVDYFTKPGAILFLLFIFLYKLGDNMAAQMNMPYYLKMGFTKIEVGSVTKVVGWLALAAGGVIGGFIMARIKVATSLLFFGILQGASTLAFTLLEMMPKDVSVLTFVIAFENITAGMGTAAFAAFMAGLTNKKFSGTQYALLTSFMRIPAVVFAGASGLLAESLGWFNFYAFCTLIAIPGLLLIYPIRKYRES